MPGGARDGRAVPLKKGNPVAIVIDNSAAMQALTPDGKTRFQDAIIAAGDALDRERGSGQVVVYVTAPQPHQLGGVMSGIGEAKDAIARAQLVDAPDDPAALTTLLGQLASDNHLGRIIFASYRSIAAPVPPRVEPLMAGTQSPTMRLAHSR